MMGGAMEDRAARLGVPLEDRAWAGRLLVYSDSLLHFAVVFHHPQYAGGCLWVGNMR